MPSNIIFPNSGLQVLSCCIHLLGVSILSHCISRRVTRSQFPTWSSLFESWPHICIVLAFVDSWLFIFTSGITIFGIGLEHHASSCAAAINICIIFYGTSKLLVYLFLIEKVHVVWSRGKPRFQSFVYILCLVNVCLYAVPVLLMIFGRVNMFREDGACIIGLKRYSSITMLAYDLWINIFLTGMFLTPILRSSFVNARVRRVTIRTLIASIVGLMTSSANMAALTVLHGRELGWLCLACCSLDVIANVLALFWVTDTRGAPLSTSSTSMRESVISGEQRSRPTTLLYFKAIASSPFTSPPHTPSYHPHTPHTSTSHTTIPRISSEPDSVQDVPLMPLQSRTMDRFRRHKPESIRNPLEINVTTRREVVIETDSGLDVKTDSLSPMIRFSYR